jgi:gas vesicle protein
MTNYYDYRYRDTDQTSGRSTPGWVVGLIAGAAVGGGLALLFAPRQGVHTRHQLVERGQEAGRQLRNAYESAAGTARRSARRLSEQAHDWRSHVSDVASKANDALTEGERHIAEQARVMAPSSSEPRSPFS